MAGRKRVAVIGAGISGLVSVKSCLEEGLEPVCFEQYNEYGGLWYYTEEYRPNQGARAFFNLTSNVCKDMFAFSDFPFPDDCPTYLTCSEVKKYIHAYCDKFDLNRHIHLNTKVLKVRKSRDYDDTGKWEVETESSNGQKTDIFDFIIICSGFYKKGRYPDVPGFDTFQGEKGHSLTYRDGQKYKGKRVLVVGNSNSSGDLTTFTANYADQVYYSVGRGTYLMPRYGPKGYPWEYTIMKRSNFSTMKKANKVVLKYCNSFIDLRKAGISPATPPLMSRLIINDEIQIKILNGKVKVVDQLARIGPHEAEFADGTVVENLDAILFATGYDRIFDFMEEELQDDSNKMTLYKMMFPVQMTHNTLALVGIVDVDGSVPPVSELQARIIARVFAGNLQLPSRQLMKKEVDGVNAFVLQCYGRYKYLMPYLPYKEELASMLGVAPSRWDLVKAGLRLARLYYYFPAFPYHYRLWGPHSWAGARDAIEKALENGYYTKQPRKAPACDL